MINELSIERRDIVKKSKKQITNHKLQERTIFNKKIESFCFIN